SEPGGGRVPGIIIGELENLFAGGILQPERLAAVVERARVLSGDCKAGVAVTRVERRGVSYHQDRRTGGQVGRGAAGEIEIDTAGKPHASQVHRHRSDVFQLDIFKL